MIATAYSFENLHRRIKRRHEQYVKRRDLYDKQRDAIVEVLRPDLVSGQVGQKAEGAFEGSAIVEGTGPHALRVWARGFRANLISRKLPWFRERVKDPPWWAGVSFDGNDEVNRYQQDLADHMSAIYRRSNYYDVTGRFILDGGSIGSPAMLFQNDLVRDRMICRVPDYASVWFDKDIFDEDNCIHVKYQWSALQVEEMFGKDQLPQTVQKQLEQGNHHEKSNYLQVIYGAGDPIYQDLPEPVLLTHPWMEHFICLDVSGQLEEVLLKPKNQGGGYFTRPWSSWHTDRNDHEVYSRTMAWWAIYDIRGANAMWEALFGEAELSLRPATWARDTLQGLLDLGPAGENYARTSQEYEQPPVHLERKTRYDVAIDFTNQLGTSCRRWFHYKFFMAINEIIQSKTQPETAFGLYRAQAENGLQLVEEIESAEQQVLGHTHDVFMDHEIRAAPAYPWGRLPKPPDILLEYADGKVDVEFIGPLSMMEVNNRHVDRFYRAMEPAQIIFENAPETRYKLRWADILEELVEAENLRQDHIVPDDEFQQVVEGVRQRALQQEVAEMAPKLAQAAKALGSETEKGSPMAALMGSTA
jgi:hypothetical protein